MPMTSSSFNRTGQVPAESTSSTTRTRRGETSRPCDCGNQAGSGRALAGRLLAAALLLGLSGACLPAAAEDFRVQNSVFVDKQTDPVSRSTTIFRGEMVFDYMDDPEEVIVYDKPGERFVLLDLRRRIRTQLTCEEVQQFSERLRQWAATSPDPAVKFAATPQFEQKFDAASDELTLASPWMTYRLLLAGVGNGTIAKQYHDFTDQLARLNTVLHPGARPPQARLVVNEEVARREAVPREVYLTLKVGKTFPARQTTIHSQHRMVPSLAESDQDRISQTQQFMDIFKQVSFADYRKRS